MFAIYEKRPVYCNRDGIAGYTIQQVSEYVYETEGLAHRKVPSSYDEDGQCMEVDFYVARTSNPHKRVCRAVPADWSDDIPF